MNICVQLWGCLCSIQEIETRVIFVNILKWQLKRCFGFDTFFATDVRRFGDGGIFIGNLRKPIEEVIPKLEQKLSDAAGREVVIWLMEEKTNDITKQVLEDLDVSNLLLKFVFSTVNYNVVIRLSLDLFCSN